MALLSKLNRLINYKAKLLKIFTKVISKLEMANQQLEDLNTKAIAKVEHFQKILEDGNVQLEENKKTIEKFKEFLK